MYQARSHCRSERRLLLVSVPSMLRLLPPLPPSSMSSTDCRCYSGRRRGQPRPVLQLQLPGNAGQPSQRRVAGRAKARRRDQGIGAVRLICAPLAIVLISPVPANSNSPSPLILTSLVQVDGAAAAVMFNSAWLVLPPWMLMSRCCSGPAPLPSGARL